jgi:hypothetical protein
MWFILEYKYLLGIASVVIGLLAFVPYFRDLKRGTTKPHLFTWLIWGFVYLIAFSAQTVEDAGPGAWFVAADAVACFGIAIFALFRGEKNIAKTDWLCLLVAVVGIGLWVSTDNPLWAVIAAVVVEIFAFAPTYRKTYLKPYEETASSYAWAVIAVALSLAALESYSITTWLYPLAIVLTNSGFVLLIWIRRSQVKRRLLDKSKY